MRFFIISTSLSIVFLFAFVGCGCHSHGVATPDAAVDSGLLDSEIQAEASQPDASLDAMTFECIDARPGSETLLPNDINAGLLGGEWVDYPYWVYAKKQLVEGEDQFDIFLMNLATLEVERLTETVWHEHQPIMRKNEIIWGDTRFYTPENNQQEIYLYNITSKEATRLTESTFFDSPVDLSDTHFLYITTEDVPEDSSWFNLILWERGTENRTVLATHDQSWGRAGFVNDRYVAWTGDSSEAPPGDEQVHLYDIQTQTVNILESTIGSTQKSLSHDQKRLVWQDSRPNGTDWNIYTYDLETGEEKALTDEPHDQCYPGVWRHLVFWKDFRRTDFYCEYNSIYPSDTMIYDLETGVLRRINSCPNITQYYVVGDRYFMRYERIDPQTGRYYLVDLVEAGILDTDLHVIPEP